MSMAADLTKYLFTLGPEAIEEIEAILQVTVFSELPEGGLDLVTNRQDAI